MLHSSLRLNTCIAKVIESYHIKSNEPEIGSLEVPPFPELEPNSILCDVALHGSPTTREISSPPNTS